MMSLRLRVSALVMVVVFATHADAQLAPDSPRRTREVGIIQRVGASVVAIFCQGEDQRWVSGSGSVIHPRGYILTNDHVVQNRQGVVLVRDYPPLPFRTVGRLWGKDLAIIKVQAPQALVAVGLGRSGDLLAGEPILAGGNPGGRGVVFSAGIVSAPDVMPGTSALAMAYYPNDARDRFVQFDAAINPGNSGGPLINAEGKQIAVVQGQITAEQNINYAIPIDRFHHALHELLLAEERGDIWTGVGLAAASNTVDRVDDKSPAAAAGLRPGDVITAIGDLSVTNSVDYFVALIGRKAQDQLEIAYTRDGEKQSAKLTLAAYPAKAGLPAEGRAAGLRYRLYHGQLNKCAEIANLQPSAEGTIAGARLDQVPDLPQDHYALALEGYIDIPKTGVWSLSVRSDDGSRVFVDGQLIVDNDGRHPPQWATGSQRWQRGLHPVRIEFFEMTGEAEFQLLLTEDGTDKHQPAKFFIDK